MVFRRWLVSSLRVGTSKAGSCFFECHLQSLRYIAPRERLADFDICSTFKVGDNSILAFAVFARRCLINMASRGWSGSRSSSYAPPYFGRPFLPAIHVGALCRAHSSGQARRLRLRSHPMFLRNLARGAISQTCARTTTP